MAADSRCWLYSYCLHIIKSDSLIFYLCHEREARYTGHNRAKMWGHNHAKHDTQSILQSAKYWATIAQWWWPRWCIKLCDLFYLNLNTTVLTLLLPEYLHCCLNHVIGQLSLDLSVLKMLCSWILILSVDLFNFVLNDCKITCLIYNIVQLCEVSTRLVYCVKSTVKLQSTNKACWNFTKLRPCLTIGHRC